MHDPRSRPVHRRSVLLLILLVTAAALFIAGIRRYRQGDGLRFAAHLGPGINLVNALDAHGTSRYRKDPTPEDYETFWNNPPISEALLIGAKEAGFRSVRIPVTWEEHMDNEGMVDPAWMDRVDEVVRLALKQGLQVILDTHHESWLDLSGDRESREAKLAALWKQIALCFADCGEALLFEGMNEPRLRDSALEWTDGTPELREEIDRLNRIFVETVRTAGGVNNKKRWLLIATYANNTGEAALRELRLPDRRCIVSLHVYETYDFCQKESGSNRWDPDGTGAEKLLEVCERISSLLGSRRIPAVFTECGCVDKANEADRVLWVQTLRKGAERCRTPWIWWDNGSTYRLLDRNTGEAIFPILVRALTSE